MATVKQVKKALGAKTERRKPIPDEDKLSLGLTVLNLAISGEYGHGVAKGQCVRFVGDSSSGKTWLFFQMLAEAARNPYFRDYRFIFDNVENGALMDVERYFGAEVARRLEPPRGTRAKPQHSRLVEEFYYNYDNAVQDGRPFLYGLDSMDALDSRTDEAKFRQHKAAFYGKKKPGDEEVKGSFAMGKPKENSMNIKRAITALRDSGSILYIVSQTRQKIGTPFPMKTSSGGDALHFYPHLTLWTSVKGDIKRTVLGKSRVVGSFIQVDVRKNRVTGLDTKVVLPFMPKTGFDETGACVDYLCDEKHWKREGREEDRTAGKITAPEFGIKEMPREKLVQYIEESDARVRKLTALTQFVFRKIDEATTLVRRRRYS
jgi:hypothetical protein